MRACTHKIAEAYPIRCKDSEKSAKSCFPPLVPPLRKVCRTVLRGILWLPARLRGQTENSVVQRRGLAERDPGGNDPIDSRLHGCLGRLLVAVTQIRALPSAPLFCPIVARHGMVVRRRSICTGLSGPAGACRVVDKYGPSCIWRSGNVHHWGYRESRTYRTGPWQARYPYHIGRLVTIETRCDAGKQERDMCVGMTKRCGAMRMPAYGGRDWLGQYSCSARAPVYAICRIG